MINVTKSYLPPLESYVKHLEDLWDSGWLTNNGKKVQELEASLSEFLGVPYVQFVSNGTIAIQLALRALDISGEVITTPFSYVATTNSLLWENCTPVFVDVDPITLCIDPAKVEAAITERTQAILPVHVYGYPCDVHSLADIARRYGLKIIYDAAHAFGCRYEGESLLKYGDISTLSFHATKLFHTVEGGAVIVHTAEMAERINKLKSFGHWGDEYFMAGVNGKNSEFHAAMGLAVLPKVSEIMQQRKVIFERYNSAYSDLGIVFHNLPLSYEYNYAYYPVIFDSESDLLSVRQTLLENDINPRRYFYPALNKLPFLKSYTPCPIAEDISLRILCLPLYAGLAQEDVDRIVHLTKKGLLKNSQK